MTTEQTKTPVKHPRLLLLIAKVSVVAFAFHLCGGMHPVMMPLHRMLLFASLLALLPLFGWLVPTTIAGILMSLATPDVATMTILIAFAFAAGCILDWIANRLAVRDSQHI